MGLNVIKSNIKAKRIADITKVVNKNAHVLAASKYNHIRVQMTNGEEQHLLFTDSQLKNAIYRAGRNPEDLPKVSWLMDIMETEVIDSNRMGDMQEVINKNKLPAAAKTYNHLRVDLDGQEIHLLLTNNDVKVALKRAAKNPEDLPKISWLRDILD